MQKIPKIIHRIWLGEKPMPFEYINNGKLLEKHYPDYEILFWHSKGQFPVSCDAMVKGIPTRISTYDFQTLELHECYNHPTTTIVMKTDILRIEILKKYGGIYFDTDIMSLRPMDIHPDCELLIAQEHPNHKALASGFIGSIPNHIFLQRYISNYGLSFEPKWSKEMALNCCRFLTSLSEITNEGYFLAIQTLNHLQSHPAEWHKRNELYQFPLQFYTSLMKDNCLDCMVETQKERFPKAYFLHYFAGAWLPKSNHTVNYGLVGINKEKV